MTWAIFSVMFFVLSLISYKNAIAHARMYAYKPIIGDFYFWWFSSIVMSLGAIFFGF